MKRASKRSASVGEEARYMLTPKGEVYLLARNLASPVEARRGELAELLDEAAATYPGGATLQAFARGLRGTFPRGPVVAALMLGATMAVAAKILEDGASTLREGAVDDDTALAAIRLVSRRLREVPSLVKSIERFLSCASRTAEGAS